MLRLMSWITLVLLAFLLLLGGCDARPPAVVMIPEAMEDCPLASRVPPRLPPLVGPETLRTHDVLTELARRGDHQAALVCRSNLLGVVTLVNEFNERQRQNH